MKKISLLVLTLVLCFSAYAQSGVSVEVNVIDFNSRYTYGNNNPGGALRYADESDYYNYFTLKPGYNQMFISLYALQNPRGMCIDLTDGTDGPGLTETYLEKMEIVTDRGVLRTTYPFNGQGRHHVIPLFYNEILEPGFKINIYFKGDL